MLIQYSDLFCHHNITRNPIYQAGLLSIHSPELSGMEKKISSHQKVRLLIARLRTPWRDLRLHLEVVKARKTSLLGETCRVKTSSLYTKGTDLDRLGSLLWNQPFLDLRALLISMRSIYPTSWFEKLKHLYLAVGHAPLQSFYIEEGCWIRQITHRLSHPKRNEVLKNTSPTKKLTCPKTWRQHDLKRTASIGFSNHFDSTSHGVSISIGSSQAMP